MYLQGIGTTGKVGIGGTYQGVNFDLGARAVIEDGATVRALDRRRRGRAEQVVLVALTQQGGNATQVGISGAFTLVDQTTTAIAAIEDTANVFTGGDLDGRRQATTSGRSRSAP